MSHTITLKQVHLDLDDIRFRGKELPKCACQWLEQNALGGWISTCSQKAAHGSRTFLIEEDVDAVNFKLHWNGELSGLPCYRDTDEKI